MRPSVPDVHITDARDADFAGYRPFVWQAIASLLLSLASPAAFLDLGFLFIPALSAILAIWALRRIGKDATGLSGLKTAWVGLGISVVFLAAVPTDMVVYRRTVTDEAKQVSQRFIQLLMHGEPQKAFQLTVSPQARQPFDGKLWDFYRHHIKQRADLENFTKQPAIRALLDMGAKSQVRFYQVADVTQDSNSDYVVLWYAVTYEEEGEKRSFFINLPLHRVPLDGHRADWQVLSSSLGKPEGV